MAKELERLRELRDEYEAALDGAAQLREDYHRAIIQLHRSGVSLREIADALGVSHQRVHQIVGPRVEPAVRKRKVRGTVVAVVFALMVVGGAAFVLGTGGSSPSPVATSPTGPALPTPAEKDAACDRFQELFAKYPAIDENVDCAVIVGDRVVPTSASAVDGDV